MKNKLKQQGGNVLSIVLMIVTILTIITLAIFSAVSVQFKLSIRQMDQQMQKITLENHMYDYLNQSVVLYPNIIVSAININKGDHLQITPVTINGQGFTDQYLFSLRKNDDNYQLIAEVAFHQQGYTMIRWGISYDS